MRSERTQRQIDDLIEAGWRISEETPERTVLVKREYGDPVLHLVILVLTFWTGGIVNVAYAAYKYLNSPRKVLRDAARSCRECGESVPEGAEYCPACGTEQPSQEPTPATTCPDCGAAVSEGAKYCSSCGAELAAAG